MKYIIIIITRADKKAYSKFTNIEDNFKENAPTKNKNVNIPIKLNFTIIILKRIFL